MSLKYVYVSTQISCLWALCNEYLSTWRECSIYLCLCMSKCVCNHCVQDLINAGLYLCLKKKYYNGILHVCVFSVVCMYVQGGNYDWWLLGGAVCAILFKSSCMHNCVLLPATMKAGTLVCHHYHWKKVCTKPRNQVKRGKKTGRKTNRTHYLSPDKSESSCHRKWDCYANSTLLTWKWDVDMTTESRVTWSFFKGGVGKTAVLKHQASLKMEIKAVHEGCDKIAR